MVPASPDTTIQYSGKLHHPNEITSLNVSFFILTVLHLPQTNPKTIVFSVSREALNFGIVFLVLLFKIAPTF